MSRHLYLVRHGQAAPPAVLAGRTDYELTAQGRKEILSLKKSLGNIAFNLAYVSPLTRTRQTLEILLGKNPTTVIVEPELTEISLGLWDGLTKSEIKEKWPDQWAIRGQDIFNNPPPEGESFNQLALRVWPVFDKIKLDCPDLTIVVAHQAVNRVILAREKNIPLTDIMDIPQPTGALTVLEI